MIEIKQEENSFGFQVQTEGGQILMTSTTVSTLTEMESLLALVKKRKSPLLRFERKTNHKGQFLFNVKDLKGQLIGHSQEYGSEAGMENGIKNLKTLLAAL